MPRSLYERLGGYGAIAAVVDDLLMRLGNDTKIAKYFIGHGDESKKHIRQLQVDMLCEASGGPCIYIGRDMKTVHKGLNINEDEWQTAMNHLVATLDKFNVQGAEQKEILAMLSGLKGDIVEKS